MSSGLLLASVTDGLWKLTHEGDKGGGRQIDCWVFFVHVLLWDKALVMPNTQLSCLTACIVQSGVILVIMSCIVLCKSFEPPVISFFF